MQRNYELKVFQEQRNTFGKHFYQVTNKALNLKDKDLYQNSSLTFSHKKLG